jgi:hypothetical protein
VAVNLVARRVQQLVLAQVSPQLVAALEEGERELRTGATRQRPTLTRKTSEAARARASQK